MFSLSNEDAALAQLSNFAGRHLAFAGYMLLRDGFLNPFGMTLTLSLWHGATEELAELRTDDPRLISEIAEHWLLKDHKKAKFVSVAIDSYSIVDGARTAAVIVSARPRNYSASVLVFLPYAEKTDDSPVRLQAPRVDFPAESVSLLPKRDFVLANVLKGRDSSPLSKAPI
jgi:hypothetical protein